MITTTTMAATGSLLREEERLRQQLLHNPVVQAIGAGSSWLDHKLFDQHPRQRYGVGVVTGAFLGGLFVSALSSRSGARK